jgi:hypothetical protein
MSAAKGKLKLDRAIDLLHHKGSRLVKMHTARGGMEWFILPAGGIISTQDAATILARPDIRGQKDCLFPGLDQTYQMVRLA